LSLVTVTPTIPSPFPCVWFLWVSCRSFQNYEPTKLLAIEGTFPFSSIINSPSFSPSPHQTLVLLPPPFPSLSLMPRDTCAPLALLPASPLQLQPPAVAAASAPGVLAPGFRFHPTDEELVIYYLKRKVGNKPVRFNAIAEVDIYKNEPWELADKSRLKSRDQEWYFFSALDKKYGNGARMNRATGKGYWKATGKDREIRRDNQLLAMKKTLVFHSGRAPGGQRTNWVMHEYRLVDEELEKIGSLQGDSYVLCRVFHKNNIGPPSGNRYAPFLEEEWDDSRPVLVPGGDAADEAVACNEDKYCITKEAIDVNEVPMVTRDLLSLCKNESVSLCKNESVEMEGDAPMCMLNTEAPFPLIQYKRRKHGHDYDSNGSEKSTRSNQDICSSTTTTATTRTTNTTDTMMTTTAATTTAISALLEFSLMEPKQPTPPPSPKEPSSLESLVPSGCMKFINDLQREVHKVSVERETMKMEVMSAQAMIYILQSKIDVLNQENVDLKRSLSKGKM
ncbi:NAC domain containing protein 52, partial [Linum grandiflorum]